VSRGLIAVFITYRKVFFFTLSFRCCGLCEPAVKMLINSRDLEGCLNHEISNLNNTKCLFHCTARNNLNTCVDKKIQNRVARQYIS
jgi:hypothetical protein